MKIKASLSLWKRRLAYRENRLVIVRKSVRTKPGTKVTHEEAARIHKWERLVTEATNMVKRREDQLAAKTPLRERAANIAAQQVGVMETGGNNQGVPFTRYIEANGGTAPEPWCGDFVAFCYRVAGSKAVQRGWAAVRFIGYLGGMQIVKEPARGDLVCYSFDHVGIFDKWIVRSEGTFLAYEGNTGTSGAVSDSSTGGDGVYHKQRNHNQVARFVRVLR